MSLSIDIAHRVGALDLAARFDANAGVTALFGPSGAGKTTLVNIVAGLIRPDRARIDLAGRTLTDTAAHIHLAPHRRRIGYVFQDSRLFPHLSVRQNLLYGRWFTRHSTTAPALAEIVAMLGIGHLAGRRTAHLSGGERQRVAIGRALLGAPDLLLLDEPMASLDDARKAEIIPYLARLKERAGMPILYISHARDEVRGIADRVITMDNGRTDGVLAPADL